MHKVILFLFLPLTVILAQDRESVYLEVEELISKGGDFLKKTKSDFTTNELIGNIISDQDQQKYTEDKIYFVNDKYYITIDRYGHNTLGTYKFKVIKNIPVIILLGSNGERDKNYEGLIVKRGDQKYGIDWNHSYYYTYTTVKHVDKNSLFLINSVNVNEFNFYNPKISFDILNAKIGIKLKGEKIIDNIADSLKIYSKLVTVFHSGKTSIYNLKGKLLNKNIKDFYPYSGTYHQIIDSENNMFFIDTLGKKHEKPIKTRSMWGNDSNANRTVTYYSRKNKILKTTHKSYSLKRYKEPQNLDEMVGSNYILYLLQEDILTFDEGKKILNEDDLENVIREKSFEELFFLKKVFKDKKYLKEISYYLLSDFNTNIIKLPKNFKKVRFINNSNLEMNAEDYWYYNAFYKPLKPSYIIAKASTKFGVWDIEEKKGVISFDYKKIEAKKGTHLLLEKNGLTTYYPYIGLIPKYKYLSDYKEYYARFEYPNGKKGWVSRKGVEYFD